MHSLQMAHTKKSNPKSLTPFKVSYLKLFIILTTCTCLFRASTSYAKNQSILIITDNRLDIQKRVSTLLEIELKKDKNTSVEILNYQNLIPGPIFNFQHDIIVTLGTKASKLAFPPSIPIIHALTPPNTLALPRSNSYTISIDQPIARKLKFLTLLLPSAKKVGVLTASFSSKKLPTLTIEAEKLNLILYSEHIDTENNLNRKLNKLIKEIDVLFTLPDPLIHNRANTPFLLLSTYRYNIPVIGFSKPYAHAGAIAAIYSSAAQISQQINELSKQLLYSSQPISSHNLPPKYFSITINKNVANSLDLVLPSSQSIKAKLLSLEK